MIGKSLCLLAAALVAVAAPLALASAQPAGGAGLDAAEFSAKKKKVKQTTQQEYMIIRMEEATVTGRRQPQGGKTVPQAGILGWPMGLHQNPPSATGTPIAPQPPRGGGIR